MNHLQTITTSVTSLVLGALVGAGAALLLAPRSGRATRALLYNQGVILKDDVTNAVTEARWNAQRQLNHMTTQTRGKATEIRTRVGGTLERQRAALEEAVGTLAIPVQANGHGRH